MPNIVLIILLAAFPAVSTDMYLPAIPGLQSLWGLSLAEANASLVAFFACFSVFLLVHGPLSDRLGRKPVLVVGIVLYVAGCFFCAAAQSIGQLVAARMVQAAGAAAASSLALALAKDLYEGLMRQKVLACIGVIVPLCPMMAPMLGGLMLKALSWRWIFLSQGLFALSALYGAARLREPAFVRTGGGALAVLARYGILLKNVPYVVLTLAFAFMALAFYSFLAGSADIYVRGFCLSEQAFGLFFGLNALGLMLGSLACSRLCVGIASAVILNASLVGILCGGAAMLAAGSLSPWSFAASMFAVSFFLGMNRPVSNSMILDQVQQDVGAASSLMTFTNFMLGAVGMEVVSAGALPRIGTIGLMAVAGGLLPLAALAWLRRRGSKG